MMVSGQVCTNSCHGETVVGEPVWCLAAQRGGSPAGLVTMPGEARFPEMKDGQGNQEQRACSNAKLVVGQPSSSAAVVACVANQHRPLCSGWASAKPERVSPQHAEQRVAVDLETWPRPKLAEAAMPAVADATKAADKTAEGENAAAVARHTACAEAAAGMAI